MIQKDIPISKTGRYFQLGELTENTKEVWVVLHGYAQLANYFLMKFKTLESKSTVVVAPEGLHRFYWNGFSGRVVASWMTKEDRNSDIDDYVKFLDDVAKNYQGLKINVLGFSQGAATACRWIALGKTEFNRLAVWGGAFPSDIDYFGKSNLFNNLDLKVVLGTEDEYYSEEKIKKEQIKLLEKGVEFEVIRYKGGHNIYEEGLLNLII